MLNYYRTMVLHFLRGWRWATVISVTSRLRWPIEWRTWPPIGWTRRWWSWRLQRWSNWLQGLSWRLRATGSTSIWITLFWDIYEMNLSEYNQIKKLTRKHTWKRAIRAKVPYMENLKQWNYLTSNLLISTCLET